MLTVSVDAACVAVVVVTVVNVAAIYVISAASAFLWLVLKFCFEKIRLIDSTLLGGETWIWSCRGRDGQETHGCLQLKHSFLSRLKVNNLL